MHRGMMMRDVMKQESMTEHGSVLLQEVVVRREQVVKLARGCGETLLYSEIAM